ncbi:MAG: hypothetical protein J0M15_12525 [Deltaproteobacteria bacterium]|nr:hypothetical protein [Deltaproteobacteria bacterium]
MKTNFLNSLASGIITSTLIFTPSIFAKSNSEVNPKIEQLKTFFKSSKIETAKSYTEVWKNVSPRFQEKLKKDLSYLFSAFNSETFPEMKIQEFNYKGRNALKLITRIQGEQVVIEYLLNGGELLKINGVLLRANDFQNNESLNKKIGHFSFIKKGYSNFKKNIFAKSFTPTKQQWSKLTNIQKAHYFLRYRELLEASYKVYSIPEFKVVSIPNKEPQDFYSQLFFGSDAFAEAKDTSLRREAEARTSAQLDEEQKNQRGIIKTVTDLKKERFLGKDEIEGTRKGPSCIVAGYAAEWVGQSCKFSSNIEVFNTPESKKCQGSNHDTGKNKTWIACQATTYIKSDGSPVCINTKSHDLQSATHPGGVCDKGSSLSTLDDKKNFLNGWIKKINEANNTNIDPNLIEEKGGKLTTKNMVLWNQVSSELIIPLTDYIKSAMNVCVKSDGKPYTTDDPKPGDEHKYNHKLRKQTNNTRSTANNDDPAKQNEACNALLKRALDIQNLLDPENQAVTGEFIDKSCKDWNPLTSAKWIEEESRCVCDPNKGFIQDSSKFNTCKKNDRPAAAVAGETSETATAGGSIAEEAGCSSLFSPFNPFNKGCEMSGLNWLSLFALGAGGLCLAEKWICEKDKKKPIQTPAPKYEDPVPPVDPGSPTVVTPPTLPNNPPRNDPPPPASETQIDPSVPKGNGSSVPPVVR